MLRAATWSITALPLIWIVLAGSLGLAVRGDFTTATSPAPTTLAQQFGEMLCPTPMPSADELPTDQPKAAGKRMYPNHLLAPSSLLQNPPTRSHERPPPADDSPPSTPAHGIDTRPG